MMTLLRHFAEVHDFDRSGSDILRCDITSVPSVVTKNGDFLEQVGALQKTWIAPPVPCAANFPFKLNPFHTRIMHRGSSGYSTSCYPESVGTRVEIKVLVHLPSAAQDERSKVTPCNLTSTPSALVS